MTHPCRFEHRRHSMANCGRMVRDNTTVKIDSLYETTITLSIGTIADPLWTLLPANGRLSEPQDQLRNRCCHLVTITEDIERCRVLPNYFGPCQWEQTLKVASLCGFQTETEINTVRFLQNSDKKRIGVFESRNHHHHRSWGRYYSYEFRLRDKW